MLAVNGKSVNEWSSGKVAEAMQQAPTGEIQLTVASHPIVPLPAGTLKGRESPKAASPSPAASAESAGREEEKEVVEKKKSLSVDTTAAAARKSSSPASSAGTPSPNLSIVEVQSGQETMIEIEKAGKGLGLSIVGGSDTVLGSVVIHEVYPDGAASKDGRLKPGDQVLEVC